MAQRIAVWMLMVLLGGWLSAAAAKESKPPPEDDYELQKLLVDTIDQVERNYVKDISRRRLIEAAIRGILSELDPYSSYIKPEDFDRFRTTVESEFGGIGIQITMENGQLQVLSPLVGTPAYRAGLLAGDRIVEIDGQTTKDLTLDEAVRLLKGDEGTQVTLTVIHPGKSERQEIAIKRESIHIETVLGDGRKADDRWDFMLVPDKGIGYVRITGFGRDTSRDLQAALEELKKAKFKGLILDLRFNPGGLLTSAIDVSDLFVSDGRIVSTEGRNSPERVWNAHKKGTYEGFPMAVLVNRFSASAAEIVAACLQDHGRAKVIGERTWGKASVQNLIELEDRRSALKLTTASYQRPSGKKIHRFPDETEKDDWGVAPDQGFQRKLTEREMVALVQDRRERDIVRPHREPETPPSPPDETANGPEQDPPGEEPSATSDNQPPQSEGAVSPPAEETPGAKAASNTVDPQLRMAIEYLVAELEDKEKDEKK